MRPDQFAPDADLARVTDPKVRLIYWSAHEAYPTSTGMTRLLLNDIMTSIASESPTLADLGKPSCRLRTMDWFIALQSAPLPTTSTMQTHAGVALTALEDALGLVVDSNGEDDRAPRGARMIAGLQRGVCKSPLHVDAGT